MRATLVLGKQGRLTIPVAMLESLGLVEGDQLRVQLIGSRLVIDRQANAVAQLRALGSTAPRAGALVDALIAERRAAADAD